MQTKVARDIMSCRTAALGGHLYRCVGCSHIEQSYNSCRNRHCPKCQGSETARWVDERSADLLPVPYFHTVFTLPDHFNTLVLSNNKRLMYELLFRAVRETLLTLGKNNLGVTRAPPKLVPRLKKALWRDHFVEYSRSHLKSA